MVMQLIATSLICGCNSKGGDTGTQLFTSPILEEDTSEPPLEEESDTGLPTDTIEIAGEYSDAEGNLYTISEEAWESPTDRYVITTYDNDNDYAIAQTEMGEWNRFDWTFDMGGSVLFCHSVHPIPYHLHVSAL